jgi:coproporphyrinogen III oxidase-like Fe-S oxidoreductase
MDNFLSEKSPLAPLCHRGEQTADSMECVQKIQKTVKRYIKDLNNGIIPETESTKLTSTEALKEFIFLGLRKTEGININEPPPYVPPWQGGT